MRFILVPGFRGLQSMAADSKAETQGARAWRRKTAQFMVAQFMVDAEQVRRSLRGRDQVPDIAPKSMPSS